MQELAYWLISLLFVISLILGLALILKKILMPRVTGGSLLRSKGKRRLGLVEVLPLDHKTRLLLIKRDNTEHLILQGTTGETIVETGIQATANPDMPSPQSILPEEDKGQ